MHVHTRHAEHHHHHVRDTLEAGGGTQLKSHLAAGVFQFAEPVQGLLVVTNIARQLSVQQSQGEGNHTACEGGKERRR